MKRYLLALCSVLGLAFIGLSPTQAQAAVACTEVNSSNPYPYNAFSWYCGTGTAANGSTMAATVAASTGFAQNELRRAGTTYYLFGTPAEYASNFPTGPVPGPNDFGVTQFDNRERPVFSAIFQTNSAGLANPNFPYTTALQVSSALDYLWGYVMNGGIQPPINIKVSDSAAYKLQLNYDWTQFNLATKLPCTSSGSQGVFSSWASAASVPPVYTYICNGTNGNGTALAAGFSGTNGNVLNQAWPGVYTLSGSSNVNPAGVFQQNAAIIYAHRDDSTPRSMSIYIEGTGQGTPSFQCSKYLVSYVAGNGKLPTIIDTNRPAGCPTPTVAPVCLKKWRMTGYFPDGNVFDCSVAGTHGTTVATKLDFLNASGSDTTLKARFTAIQSNVYLFDTQSAYNTAFTNAGQYSFGAAPLVVAGTYDNQGVPLNTTMWYTIVNLNNFANDANVIYTTTHELGHALDDTFTHQSSSLASFDLAMQHDWQFFDYTSWTNPTTFTLRGPCNLGPTSPGPFIGVVDDSNPIPNSQFCSGGALAAGYETTTWSGKKNSDILRNAKIEGLVGHPALYQATAQNVGPIPYVSAAGWREWHAEAFAIRAQTDTASTPSNPIYSQMVQNGYFACTGGPLTSFEQLEYNTAAQPASPPCQTAMQAGWVVDHQSIASP